MATLEDLLAKYDERFRLAFLAGIDEITSKARIQDIVRALEQGDINAALEALYIDQAAFAEFEAALGDAYAEGGALTVNNLGQLKDQTGSRFVFRFNVRNFAAEQWLREHSSQLVTRIVEEQRQVVRQHLETGMSEGRNPRSVALDVTGRINRQTGRREGGVVGLSDPQEKAVVSARKELESGDFSSYLQRARRDKRFDRTIQKAIREDKPLTQDQISKITTRYKDGLLKLRGETIARTESLASLHASQYEALRQLVESGKVNANQVRRIWKATHDTRTRFSHAVADGQSVGLEEDFVMPSGARLRYPGDPKGGPAEVINCRCTTKVRIDYLANVR